MTTICPDCKHDHTQREVPGDEVRQTTPGHSDFCDCVTTDVCAICTHGLCVTHEVCSWCYSVNPTPSLPSARSEDERAASASGRAGLPSDSAFYKALCAAVLPGIESALANKSAARRVSDERREETEMAVTSQPIVADDAAGRAYFEAKQAIADLIDVSGWEDVFVLLRRLAKARNATTIDQFLNRARWDMHDLARENDVRLCAR
jgi:hypothetical protein